jgi:hypothetical protein
MGLMVQFPTDVDAVTMNWLGETIMAALLQLYGMEPVWKPSE